MNEKNKGLLWGLLAGSVAGGVTALLLAPKSGKELRHDIADGARLVGDKSQELVSKVNEQRIVLVDKIKTTAGLVIEDLQSLRACKDEEQELATTSSLDSSEEAVEEERQDETELQ
ncbi:YtxH domain-containing protein [Paenibacillus sp. JX-17]|uniref:YtxH domain-containing protein n=1 Tax=Paenibacillus lacisoli TaxID=3064525 RepID=A0ABT9C9V8_9BACL|nr:YtxH domain-containing protein [Paenibacillus sp. JX-17]MDO7906045.1 YtxH domain-containing protein [Paenibacillus sp. JX-17]